MDQNFQFIKLKKVTITENDNTVQIEKSNELQDFLVKKMKISCTIVQPHVEPQKSTDETFGAKSTMRKETKTTSTSKGNERKIKAKKNSTNSIARTKHGNNKRTSTEYKIINVREIFLC